MTTTNIWIRRVMTLTMLAHKLRLIVCLCAVATVGVTVLSACGDDTPTTSHSPGRLFQGVYSATIADRVPTSDAATPTTATWIVQSSCTGPDNGCVAQATPTVADASEPDPIQFVYEKGAWTRVVVPDKRPCTPAGMAAPVDEPWVAIDSTTMAANNNDADLPLVTLTGSIISIQGGSCSSVTEKAITLTRTGNLPPGTAPLKAIPFPEATTSPGEGFHGTYEQRTSVVSADPPSLLPPSVVQTSQISATTTCTRDGAHCVVVMLDKPAQPGQTIAAYADNAFEQTATLPERQCPGSTDRYRPILTSRTTIAPNLPNPIASMDSESALTWTGPCAGTVKFESTLSRTGD